MAEWKFEEDEDWEFDEEECVIRSCVCGVNITEKEARKMVNAFYQKYGRSVLGES